jgi:hypothetical protein
MENNKIKILLDKNYQLKIEELVKLLINNDEPSKAFSLLTVLNKAVDENSARLKEEASIYNFYQEKITELSFISFSFIDEKVALSLLKYNFSILFNLSDFDFIQELKRRLIGIILISDRDLFRTALIKSLSENNEKIVANNQFKTVREWLQNYIVSAGDDSLSRAQYLSKLKLDKTISRQEQEILLSLFKLYEFLKHPSSTPWGLEEEPAIIQNGKLFIFRKGALEPVSSKDNIEEAMFLAGEEDITSVDKASTPIESDDLFLPGKNNSITATVKNDINENIAAKPVVVTAPSAKIPPVNSALSDLEQTLKNYSTDSFEHKALLQEIGRLKKTEINKPQQSDDKK